MWEYWSLSLLPTTQSGFSEYFRRLTIASDTGESRGNRSVVWSLQALDLVALGISRTYASTRRVTQLYMETSFALTGKGYVIVAADTVAARSIVKMKSDEDKIKVLSPHLLMSYSGEPGT